VTDTALLDVDRTLVDSNISTPWRGRAHSGSTVHRWGVAHPRHIGMGGDQLVPAMVGEDLERKHGDSLRAAWRE